MLGFAAAAAIIQPIDNHNGILVLTEAKAQYQIDTYHIAVVYNTSSLRDIYIEICSNYYTMRLKQNSTISNLTINKQIEYLINIIESRLLYLGLEKVGLRPSYRNKRGLVDGLGSVIKAITGNLDQNDAMQFNSEIKTIQTAINNNKSNQRRTISIMQDFMKDFERNIRYIKKNQEEISKAINEYSKQRNDIQNDFLIKNILTNIETSLQQLYDRLEVLENAITFAHLKKMHPSIIDPTYLLEELNLIQNEISGYLAFPPNMENIHLWEKAIIVKAYSDNETLTFILDVPLVAEQPYNLLHLYSIPNANNTILIPKYPFLVLGNTEFAYPHDTCIEITEDDVICKHLEWQTLLHSNDCIAQLIQHQEPQNCTYATATYNNNIVQQIKENSWIVVIKQEEVIKTTCNNDVQYQRSKGVFLITTDSNCRVQIPNKILETHQRFVNIRETIPLPHAHLTPKPSEIRVNLENIQLDNLKDILSHAEEMELPDEDFTIVSNTPSWPSILLYIIILPTIIGVAVRKFWWKPRSANIQTPVPEAEEIQLQPQSSIRLHLKGGGVMSP